MMKQHRSRRWPWLVALALGIALLALALRPTPLPVDVAGVEIGPMMETVDEEGMTRVRDRFVVTAPVAGEVLRITIKEGDSVALGQVVARMKPLPLDARGQALAEARVAAADDALRVAAADLARATAAFAQADRGRERAESLAVQDLVSAEDREQAQLSAISRAREREAADFRAQAAAHDLEAARAALLSAGKSPGEGTATLTLRSPVAGRVLRLVEQSERVVPAGAPLLELGDPQRLEVVVDLLSTDAVRVRPGDTLLIEAWGGQQTLLGRLRTIEPSGFTKVSALGVEEQRVNVIGDFLADPRGLGDRYRVEVRVVLWRADSVLRAPASALYRLDEQWYAFVVERGRSATGARSTWRS
jgi:HlyD family secretion protein